MPTGVLEVTERRRRRIMKRTGFSNASGFSTLQLVITIAVAMVVTGFAVVSISRARDHVRLMNSARQFAAYVERARADAVRRHGTATASISDNDTYLIRMDWDGFGNATDRNFDLERGVTFTDGMVGKSITFDWRGRIAGEENFGFEVNRSNTFWRRTVNVGVTGSGDVTFEAEYFYDGNLPPVTVAGGGGGVLPEPGATPGVGGSPTPSPSPGASPTPTAGASPTPTSNPSPTASTNPSPTPTANPSPTATANPSPTPGASPTAQPCVLNANPASLQIVSNGSATVSVNRTNITGTGTINATSSNSGQIQVTPASRSVNGTAAGSFTVTVKKAAGSVTFSATGCTSKTVGITIR